MSVEPASVITKRGTVAVGGEDVARLIARAIAGRYTYEENLFRVVSGRVLTPEEITAARAALIATAVCQDPDVDLDLTRLAASTGASFEESLRPSLVFRRGLRFAAEFLEECRRKLTSSSGRVDIVDRARWTGDSLPGFDLSPRRHHAIAGQVREVFEANHVAADDLAVIDRIEASVPGATVNVTGLAAALLLSFDVPAAVASFFEMLARTPILARVYLDEAAGRPNRYVGLIEGRAEALPESEAWQDTGARLIAEGGCFIDVITNILIGHASTPPELQFFNAGLIAGAEYGKTAASSSLMRIMASRGATFEEAYEATFSTFGFYHLGALRECAVLMVRASAHLDDLDGFIDQWLAKYGDDTRQRVPGFGHRFQHADPRAATLLSLCRRTHPGPFLDLAATLDEKLFERRLGHINMDGIGAAMGLQVGVPASVTSVLSLVARTPGLVKEYREECGRQTLYALRQRDGLA